MRKTLTYSSLIIAALLVVLVFVTAKTYLQLILGIILYPMLVYSAYRLLSHEALGIPAINGQIGAGRLAKRAETPKVGPEMVADIDKRTFLKLIGATGLSLFLFSLVNKKDNLEQAIRSGVAGLGNAANQKIPLANSSDDPMEGYKVAQIDDNEVTYYGFTNKDGAWIIMKEDTETSSFRYVRGDSDFPGNWAIREKLKYDYFDKVF